VSHSNTYPCKFQITTGIPLGTSGISHEISELRQNLDQVMKWHSFTFLFLPIYFIYLSFNYLIRSNLQEIELYFMKNCCRVCSTSLQQLTVDWTLRSLTVRQAASIWQLTSLEQTSLADLLHLVSTLLQMKDNATAYYLLTTFKSPKEILLLILIHNSFFTLTSNFPSRCLTQHY